MVLRVARREGIVLDPVYTAKAFGGLLDHTQRIPATSGRRVCFIHTGGVFSVYPFREALSRLADVRPLVESVSHAGYHATRRRGRRSRAPLHRSRAAVPRSCSCTASEASPSRGGTRSTPSRPGPPCSRSTCPASDAPPSRAPRYRLGYFARALHGFLDAMGVAQASLVGHSLGGAVAVTYALTHPTRRRAGRPRGGARARLQLPDVAGLSADRAARRRRGARAVRPRRRSTRRRSPAASTWPRPSRSRLPGRARLRDAHRRRGAGGVAGDRAAHPRGLHRPPRATTAARSRRSTCRCCSCTAARIRPSRRARARGGRRVPARPRCAGSMPAVTSPSSSTPRP